METVKYDLSREEKAANSGGKLASEEFADKTVKVTISKWLKTNKDTGKVIGEGRTGKDGTGALGCWLTPVGTEMKAWANLSKIIIEMAKVEKMSKHFLIEGEFIFKETAVTMSFDKDGNLKELGNSASVKKEPEPEPEPIDEF